MRPGMAAQSLRSRAETASKDLAQMLSVTKAGFARDDFQRVRSACIDWAFSILIGQRKGAIAAACSGALIRLMDTIPSA